MDGRFGAYLLVATLLIVTPGPDTALTIRNALRFGWRASSMSTFGIGLGSLIWGIAAVLGIAVLLERSVVAFTIFKLAGAAYLIFLGLRSILGTLRSSTPGVPGPHPDPPPQAGEGDGRAGRKITAPPIRDEVAFKQGVVNNLLNPKAGAIFATVFPQFIAPTDSPLRLVLMMLAYEIVLVFWLNLYGCVLSRAGRARLTGRLRHALERLTGAVLVGLGVRLAFEAQ